MPSSASTAACGACWGPLRLLWWYCCWWCKTLRISAKCKALTDSYAMLQSQLSSTTADLSTRMDGLQNAVRQGKSTVLEWHWVPVDKLHRDVQSSWMPVLVQVTPSESTTGMTARLSVTYGDTTELHDMDVLAGDIYQAQLVFTVGQTYDLTIQWTAADGAAANEKLGTVDFTATQTEPELAWGQDRRHPGLRLLHQPQRQ